MVFIISSQITNRNRKVPGYSPGKPNLLQVHFGSGRTRRWDLHYLLHCTCHANHREIFTTYFTSECRNFQNLDDKCKLIWVLNNEDSTILRYLCQYLLSTTIWLNGIGDLQTGWPALSMRKKKSFWHHPLMLTAGYPKALIPFHVPNNIPSTSTWPVCTRHK